MFTPFAGMSIISTKSGWKLPGQGPGASASRMSWSQRKMSKRWTAKRIFARKERMKIAARHFSGVSPINGVSFLGLVLSGGGSPLLEVWGKSFCVSCLDCSYTCLNKKMCSAGALIRQGLIRCRGFHWGLAWMVFRWTIGWIKNWWPRWPRKDLRCQSSTPMQQMLHRLKVGKEGVIEGKLKRFSVFDNVAVWWHFGPGSLPVLRINRKQQV